MSSMIPIEVLVRPITASALSDLLFDALETMGIPARSWRPGGVGRSVVGVVAMLGAQGSTVVADCIAGLFLAFAKGDYLTAHAKDTYDVDRIGATFASGSVLLRNEGGAVHEYGADQIVVRSSNTGARYRITQAFVLGSGSPGAPTTLTVTVSAIEPGSASSVGAGELDEFETTMTKASVVNLTALVGSDAESDDELRRRCLLKRATWSPFGPRDAYEFAALVARLPDGAPTGISRVRVKRVGSKGEVLIICATPTGAPTSDALDAVRASAEKIARPDTVKVTVTGAVPKSTAQSLIVWCRGGSIPLIRTRAQSALAKLISAWPIGGISKSENGPGFLFSDAIAAAVVGSSPEAFDVDFDGDSVDMPLAFNEVASNTTTFDVRIV